MKSQPPLTIWVHLVTTAEPSLQQMQLIVLCMQETAIDLHGGGASL